MQRKLDRMFQDVSIYNHGNWGYIDVDTAALFDEITRRMEQGHYRLAFSEAEMLYRKLLENFECQAECELSEEAENCLELMSTIADNTILDEDKNHIFQHCLALSDLDDGKDYGADYEDKLLRIAAKFVTPENCADLEAALAALNAAWRGEEVALIRFEIASRLEGESAAADFISKNLQYPQIREIAFEQAISNDNLAEAEKLCEDALLIYKEPYGISPWLYRLYSVHEKRNHVEKMASTAEAILLYGDLEHYDVLKTLLKRQNLWETSYPELIQKCKHKLRYSEYMKILEKENEYERLLQQLDKHRDEVYNYGALLASRYPLDIRKIFNAQIDKEADAAYGRESYSRVCQHILAFAQAGYDAEPIQLMDAYTHRYKRKPAFVDELNKSKAALYKQSIKEGSAKPVSECLDSVGWDIK